MIVCDHKPPTIAPSGRAAIVVLVVLLHLLLLYWLAMIRADAMPAPSFPPPMDVQLFRAGGGGSPGSDSAAAASAPDPSAIASAVHRPSDPQPWPETLAAPPRKAAPELLVGFGSPVQPSTLLAEAEPAGEGAAGAGDAGGGSGGGTGGGAGTGNGPGAGPGRSGASGAVLIRGPAGAAISRDVSPTALAALPGSYGVLRCQIRLTQRLDNCRVLDEHPRGSGVGAAALRRAGEFRFTPPRAGLRYIDRRRITVAIAFPPDAEGTAEP